MKMEKIWNMKRKSGQYDRRCALSKQHRLKHWQTLVGVEQSYIIIQQTALLGSVHLLKNVLSN